MKPAVLASLMVLLLSLVLGALLSCGGGEGDRSDEREEGTARDGSDGVEADTVAIPDSPVGLIPIDSRRVIIFDVSEVLGDDVPRRIREDFEYRADHLLDGEVDLDDIDILVVVDDTLLAQGDFDFPEVREYLEDLGYESDLYRGFEIWGERAALVEDDNYVILGFASEAVRDILRSLDRGRDLLAFEQNSDLAHIVDGVGSGAIVLLTPNGCGEFGSSGCDAGGASFTFPGSQPGLALMRLFLLYEDEDFAEDGLAEWEDSLLDDSDVVEVLAASADNNAVILEVEAEDYLVEHFYEFVASDLVARRLGPGSEAAAPARPWEAGATSTPAGVAATRPWEAGATSTPAVEAPTIVPTRSSFLAGNAGRIRPGEIVSEILGRAETHRFEFDARRGQTYIIETFAQFDSYLDLYDESSYHLTSDDDGGSGASSLISWTAGYSGAHVVEVRGYSDSDSGSYDLVLTELGPDDHAGSFDDATRIDADQRLDGFIEPGDEDFFVLNARSGVGYMFETHTGFDTVMELYDEDGYEIGYDDDGGVDVASRLTWTAGYSGNHYLKVRAYEASDSGHYQLSLTQIRIVQDDHGDDIRNATPLRSNEIILGNIQEDDQDFFEIAVRRDSFYIFETEADFDTTIQLLDDSGREVGFDDDGGVDGASYLEWIAPSDGVYFIVVAGYDYYSIGEYVLYISESR